MRVFDDADITATKTAGGNVNRIRSARPTCFISAALCFLLVVGIASTAVADETESSALPSLSSALLDEAINSPNAQTLESFTQTDTQAARQLPHDELDRSEALTLLTSVFGDQIESLAGIFDEMDVERFISDNAAVMPAGSLETAATMIGEEPSPAQSAEPVLVESSLPLRTEDAEGHEAPVDLSLEHNEGELQPANPLVTTGIPAELGEGISLANAEIKLEFPEASDVRTPSVVEHDAAFYPNVQADTDLLVTPTASGVETLTQLRTPEAPRTETVQVDLPEGATLKETAAGGAEATQNGRALLSVAPPSALDANGNEVPVSLSVAGHSIELEVSPTESNTFPILVDPLWRYEMWNWTWGNSSLNTWEAVSSTPSYQSLPYSYWDPGHLKGLDMTSGFAGSAKQYDAANWFYHVPRFASDWAEYKERPQSFIHYLAIGGVEFLLQGNNAVSPVLVAGIVDESAGGWVTVGQHSGYDGEISGFSGSFGFENWGDVNAKYAVVALTATQAEAQAKYRNAFVATGWVGMSDHDTPYFTKLSSPSEWMNTTETSHIGYSVTDKGLGVFELTLVRPQETGRTEYGLGCSGLPASPCKRIYDSGQPGSVNLAINPASASQGVNPYKVVAVDSLGSGKAPNPGETPGGEPYTHAVTGEVLVKIDHTAPTLSVSGSITEQATLGTVRPQYTLKYAATDGSELLPTIRSSFGSEGTGNAQFKHPADITLDPSENIWVADENNNRIEKFNEKSEYASAYGSLGSGNGQLNHPTGLEADSKGNIWVADTGNNRIEEFSKDGSYVAKFGSLGSGNGQLSSPQGISIDSKGNIWVADTGNNRIQKFSASGTFLSSFGSKGSGAGQLSEPAALDVGPDGNVWVADAGNNRVEKFNEKGEYLAAYGSLGSGNGQFDHPGSVDVDTWGNVWVADQNNNRVEQFSERGEYLGKFGNKGTGSGQFSFAGPIGLTTNRAGLLWVTDSGDNRIENWTAPQGTRSGVRSVAIKVDGKVVEEPKLSCEVGGCPLAGEWTLPSSEYSAGTHTVEVVATDGVQLSISKKLTIEVQRDTEKPTIQTSGELADAPSGWVQQESYGLNASAADAGGYGVTSLAFRIDGAAVTSMSKVCPDGGCEATISKSISMASYSGGAHEAEIVATDGAGNTATKRWTINVDPEGHVSTEEATATLEAFDATSSVNAVGQSQAEEGIEGTAQGLGIEQAGSELVATGTAAPVTIASTSVNGFTVKVPEARELTPPCHVGEGTEEPESEGEEAESEGSEEPCLELTEGEVEGDEDGFVPIQIRPIGPKGDATTPQIAEENAVVSGNTTNQGDTVIRPLTDGGMTFQSIRDESASEEYSWRVELGHDQVLRQIDARHAEVYYNNYTPALAITAESAHDAVGTTVPTSLSVSGGDVITLTVHFKAGNPGGPFVYPILAGTGWEGGFRTVIVDMNNRPPEEEEEGEIFEIEPGLYTFTQNTIGPPEAAPGVVAPGAAQQLINVATTARAYNFNRCHWRKNGGTIQIPQPPKRDLASISQQCHGTLRGGDYSISWALSMSGKFFYKYGHWVWIRDEPNCRKWGESQPAVIHCYGPQNNPSQDKIDVISDIRFPPAHYAGAIWALGRAWCAELDGVLPIRPIPQITGEQIYRERAHFPGVAVWPNENCPWGHFSHPLDG